MDALAIQVAGVVPLADLGGLFVRARQAGSVEFVLVLVLVCAVRVAAQFGGVVRQGFHKQVEGTGLRRRTAVDPNVIGDSGFGDPVRVAGASPVVGSRKRSGHARRRRRQVPAGVVPRFRQHGRSLVDGNPGLEVGRCAADRRADPPAVPDQGIPQTGRVGPLARALGTGVDRNPERGEAWGSSARCRCSSVYVFHSPAVQVQ